MTKAEVLARHEFENTVRRESEPSGLSWHDRVQVAKLLMRHARTYARVQEAMCNGVKWDARYDTNESFRKRQEAHEQWCARKDAQLEKRITEIVEGLGKGWGVKLGGDPRGCTVKLVLPSGRTDDFGGEGYCVPGA